MAADIDLEVVFEDGLLDSFTPSSGALPIDEVTVFVSTETQKCFFILPLEAGPAAGQKLARILNSIFKDIQEWPLVGRGGLFANVPVVFVEIGDGGDAVVDMQGQTLSGALRFVDGGQRALLDLSSGGSAESVEIAMTGQTMTLVMVPGFAGTVYGAVAETVTQEVGAGQLYRVNFPERSLTPVNGAEPDALPALVLVHGGEAFEPMRGLFQETPTGVVLSDMIVPMTADDVRGAVLTEWKAALDVVDRPNVSGVFVYVYNPLVSVSSNASAFAAKMRTVFNWSNRNHNVTIVAHSTGGLVAAYALADDLGLAPPPGSVRLLTFATPFRGPPPSPIRPFVRTGRRRGSQGSGRSCCRCGGLSTSTVSDGNRYRFSERELSR